MADKVWTFTINGVAKATLTHKDDKTMEFSAAAASIEAIEELLKAARNTTELSKNIQVASP